MDIHEVSIDRLEAHPHNSNVMSEDAFHKLVRHIERNDQCPPIILRPHPENVSADEASTQNGPKHYQMLDGRHRVKALKQLRRTAARCVIWHVDEAESLTLLATLNRLEGRDDPHKRAALLDALQEQRDRASLAADLPAPAARLNRMLQAHHAPPTPASPEPAVSLPEAMHFFFKPETRRAIEARLNAYDADRHQALLKALGVGHTVRVVPPRAAPVRKRFS